eukprot:7058408-Pyramimonas_sp.AAC.1
MRITESRVDAFLVLFHAHAAVRARPPLGNPGPSAGAVERVEAGQRARRLRCVLAWDSANCSTSQGDHIIH